MTDWVTELQDRMALMHEVARALDEVLTSEERAKLRRLAQEWPP